MDYILQKSIGGCGLWWHKIAYICQQNFNKLVAPHVLAYNLVKEGSLSGVCSYEKSMQIDHQDLLFT